MVWLMKLQLFIVMFPIFKIPAAEYIAKFLRKVQLLKYPVQPRATQAPTPFSAVTWFSVKKVFSI